MKITGVAGSDIFSNPHKVDAKKIFESPQAAVIHMALKPGENLKSHITPVDILFYILEGEPTIEIGNEREKVSADSIVESPADIPHCVYNESDSLTRFLVIKLSGSKK